MDGKQPTLTTYAFIDVPNTAGTARKLLNITIDWPSLYRHLTDSNKNWKCKNVFYYEGRKEGKEHEKRHQHLEQTGYVVRSKLKKTQRVTEKIFVHTCSNCKQPCELKVKFPGPQKSNCDVELTVDALELAASNTQFLIFSGDGDFRYLIENVVRKGIKVKIVSNTRRDKDGNKRFSTRLKELIEQEEKNGLRRVTFIDLNDWKVAIGNPIK